MKLFSFFKKKEKNENGNETPLIQLANILSDEEIRLLVTDLGLIENKVEPSARLVVAAAKEMVQEKRGIALPVLDLCIAAVEDALKTFSAFGMVPSGTSTLLEKLKAAKESV